MTMPYFLVVNFLGQPKVRQPYIIIVSQQNIVQFNVSVNYFVHFVVGFDCLAQLPPIFSHCFFLKTSLWQLRSHIVKISLLAVLKDHAHPAILILHTVNNFEHVRSLNFPHNLYFFLRQSIIFRLHFFHSNFYLISALINIGGTSLPEHSFLINLQFRVLQIFHFLLMRLYHLISGLLLFHVECRLVDYMLLELIDFSHF